MSQCQFTPEAGQDLDDIHDYIAQSNPAAADRVIDAIEQACRRLASSPGIGRRREDLGPGLRSFPVRRYVIIFRETNGGVEIVRVFHGARDIPSHFQP